MSEEDVTKHPHWHFALCDVCGKPYKLEDLNKKAQEVGVKFVEDHPRFYFACCYEPTIEDDKEYLEIVELLQRYYGM